jgi:hypothetical protein
MAKTAFYVLRDGETINRLAKIEDSIPYGYEGGEWVYMPSLIKIVNDLTDYEEIDESEANEIIDRLSGEKRFNPNHGDDGKFTSGGGGGGGGAGGSSSKNSGKSGGGPAKGSTFYNHEQVTQELAKDKYPDGTYDAETLKPVSYDDGFQVTFRQIGDIDNLSDNDYNERVNEFMAASSDKKVLAGKFEGTPEVSFHVNSREKAVELAKKYNQISVWDWKDCNEIKTGGTGEWQTKQKT